jgi:hypothetical protein
MRISFQEKIRFAEGRALARVSEAVWRRPGRAPDWRAAANDDLVAAPKPKPERHE